MLDGLTQDRRLHVGRYEVQILNAPGAGRDVGFAADASSICHHGFELNIRCGRWIDVAARGENLRRLFYRFGEVAGDGSQGGEEQVPEAVSVQIGPGLETVLEKAREQGFVLRQRGDAVANVAGREHVELLAQASAGAAIVGHRDHSREFGDTWL